MKDLVVELPIGSLSKVAVVVLPGCSILELGAVVEPLAFAARRYPACLAAIELAGPGSGPAFVNGLGLATPRTIADLTSLVAQRARPAAVFVCCGETVDDIGREELLRFMRACRRQQVRLLVTGGVIGILADSGLLCERPAAAPWKVLAALRENHPRVTFADALFISTGHLTTCAGGSAVLDMTLTFLQEILPADAVAEVRAHFMVSETRPGSDRQPGSVTALAGRLPPPLAAVILAMNSCLEAPLSMPRLCLAAGLSQRQVERLFRRHLGMTPLAFYLGQRLERARQLVRRSNLPLAEVAAATGFAGVSSLSKRYLLHFDVTPSEDRQRSQAGLLPISWTRR